MREMLWPTSAIMGKGLGKDVALITDGRFSGGSHGFVVGHITPEAYTGGPLALVKNGDRIRISVRERKIDLLVPAEELARRKSAWKPPVETPRRGYAQLYMQHVLQAEHGCDFDFLRKA